MWRQIRIGLLLLILGVAAWSNWYDRISTTDWDEPLRIGIFPIADEGGGAVASYIRSLTDADFADIEEFFAEEAARYGLDIAQPMNVTLFPPVREEPPPHDPGAGVLATMWWSLKMRLYANRASRSSGLPPPQIRIFVRYHDPSFDDSVPHSVGLQKGLVGVVHAFADPALRGANNVVISHEILHTLGASDKYHPQTLEPLFPVGYAEPERTPRYPQPFAEIMAGRRAVGPSETEIPASLREVLVGESTALEIRWVKP